MSNIFHISLKTQPLSIDKFDIFRAACTYCGGDVEDNFTRAGLLSACCLFPVGILLCCFLKEKRCVICTREVL